MKKQLFTIEQEFIQLMEEVQNELGEVTEEMAEKLKINDSEKKGKSMAYLSVIRKAQAENMLAKAQKEHCAAIEKRNNNIIERLSERLLEAVVLFGEYDCDLTKFGTRKSSSIQVDDINSLPKKYKVIKVTEQADKKELKAAIKNGEEIEGVALIEKLNLKIN